MRRELVAAFVVLAGGLLWLAVPDKQRAPGFLRDRSVVARWSLPPGRGLAAWVLVENPGPRTITLQQASIGSALPDGVEVIATRARIGTVPTVSAGYPQPTGPFRQLDGFEVPPRRGATVGFALTLPEEGLVKLENVRVGYREGGAEQVLAIRHTARICVTRRPDPAACSG